MSSEKQFLQASHEQVIHAQLERWFKTPMIAATTSKYRLQALRDVGFEQVTGLSVPDEIEFETRSALESSFRGYFDKYGRGSVEDVARAKLEYLVTKKLVPSDQFACAADTMVMMHTHRESLKEEYIQRWRPEHLHKPHDLAEARLMMRRLCLAIIAGYRMYQAHLQPAIESGEFSDEKLKGLEYGARLGNPLMRVQVNTGVAVRFPNAAGIDTFHTEVYLFPKAFYRISQLAVDYRKTTTEALNELSDDESIEVEQLVDRVMTHMKNAKTDPCKITGGINWADPEIRRLLDVVELAPLEPEEVPEEGMYLGLPGKALKRYLKQRAGGSSA